MQIYCSCSRPPFRVVQHTDAAGVFISQGLNYASVLGPVRLMGLFSEDRNGGKCASSARRHQWRLLIFATVVKIRSHFKTNLCRKPGNCLATVTTSVVYYILLLSWLPLGGFLCAQLSSHHYKQKCWNNCLFSCDHRNHIYIHFCTHTHTQYVCHSSSDSAAFNKHNQHLTQHPAASSVAGAATVSSSTARVWCRRTAPREDRGRLMWAHCGGVARLRFGKRHCRGLLFYRRCPVTHTFSPRLQTRGVYSVR